MPYSTLHPWRAAPYPAYSRHLANGECVNEVAKCPEEEAGL